MSHFSDIADRFDRGGVLVKAGIVAMVLSLIGLPLGRYPGRELGCGEEILVLTQMGQHRLLN
jgi:hypothetical protein